MAKRKTTSTTSDPERFKRVADYMQQARRAQKMSVRKVSQLTSLPESTIRALENPNRSSLPRSNVVGLYKVYASALRVPKSYVRELVGPEEDKKTEFSLQRLPKLKSFIVFSNIGVGVVVSVLILVVLSYATWQGLNLIASPSLEVVFPEQAYQVVDESAVEVSGRAPRDATVLVNGQPTTVDGNTGRFTQTVFLQRGYNYITVEAVNSFSTTTQESFVLFYQPSSLTSWAN